LYWIGLDGQRWLKGFMTWPQTGCFSMLSVLPKKKIWQTSNFNLDWTQKNIKWNCEKKI
jgi:hypothetical protein